MPLTRQATPATAPRAGSTAEAIVKIFDAGINTTRAIADLCGVSKVQRIHNTLNRWRPGWKCKMANWEEPATSA